MPRDHPAGFVTRQAGTTVAGVLRRTFRLLVALSVLGGLALAVRKLLGAGEQLTPAPVDPTPPLVAPAGWVEPVGDVCPTTHPVKGKLVSKIFHVPGGLSYDRTKPDRCYRDAAAAEADGLRPAKR
jgi:hypothetical protein